MRKRKAVKKSDDESDGSYVADEPDEPDSGEDWTPTTTTGSGSRGGNRKRTKVVNNTTKKKRKNSTTEESDPEEENDDDSKQKTFDDEEYDEENTASDDNKSDSSQSKDIPRHYHSGNFVLLKNDVKWSGDKVVSNLNELFLWKIDGKALLQKYIPIEFNGKTIHKCTCVYSGWNVDNRDNYYPITEILDKNPRSDVKEPCVALDLNDLLKVRDKN